MGFHSAGSAPIPFGAIWTGEACFFLWRVVDICQETTTWYCIINWPPCSGVAPSLNFSHVHSLEQNAWTSQGFPPWIPRCFFFSKKRQLLRKKKASSPYSRKRYLKQNSKSHKLQHNNIYPRPSQTHSVPTKKTKTYAQNNKKPSNLQNEQTSMLYLCLISPTLIFFECQGCLHCGGAHCNGQVGIMGSRSVSSCSWMIIPLGPSDSHNHDWSCYNCYLQIQT